MTTDAEPRRNTEQENATPRKRKTPRRVTRERLMRQALAHLEKFASSTENLRGVLRRRVQRAARVHETDLAQAERWIEEVLTEMTRLGYLNDERYATARAGRLSRSGKSERRIRMELKVKGLDGNVAEAAVEASRGVAEDPAAAERGRAAVLARKKRLGPFRGSGRDEARGKDLAALARAGFPYGIAKDVIDAETPDDLEEWIHAIL